MITLIDNKDCLIAIDKKIESLNRNLSSVLWTFTYQLAEKINTINLERNTSSWWTMFNNGWKAKYNWEHIHQDDITEYIEEENLICREVIDYGKFLFHHQIGDFYFQSNPMKRIKLHINKLLLMKKMIEKCFFKSYYVELNEEEFKLIYE